MKPTVCCITLLAAGLAARGQDMPLSQILIPGEGWKKVAGDFTPVKGLFAAPDRTSIHVFDERHELQAVIDAAGRVSKPEKPGTLERDLVVLPDGRRLQFNEKSKSVRFARSKDDEPVEYKLPVEQVGAIMLTPDQGTMLLADAGGKHVWYYRVDSKGLSAGEKYATLRVRKDDPRSLASAIAFDADNRVYVATREGVQVFDPTGRLCGLVLNPTRTPLTAMCLGGPDGDLLFVACGSEVYSRKLQSKRPKLPSEKK